MSSCHITINTQLFLYLGVNMLMGMDGNGLAFLGLTRASLLRTRASTVHASETDQNEGTYHAIIGHLASSC